MKNLLLAEIRRKVKELILQPAFESSIIDQLIKAKQGLVINTTIDEIENGPTYKCEVFLQRNHVIVVTYITPTAIPIFDLHNTLDLNDGLMEEAAVMQKRITYAMRVNQEGDTEITVVIS